MSSDPGNFAEPSIPRPVRTWLSRPLRPFAEAWGLGAFLFVSLLSTLAWRQWQGLDHLLAASPAQVYFQHEYWRAWTTIFLHGDLGHLLSNSFFLLIFGSLIAGFYGWRAFLLQGLFFSGLVNLITLLSLPDGTRLVGASGWVYWLGGFWLSLYLCVDRRRSLRSRLLRSAGVSLALFMPTEAFDPGISYEAHAWGFVLGVTAGLVHYWRHRRSFQAAEEFRLDDLIDAGYKIAPAAELNQN